MQGVCYNFFVIFFSYFKNKQAGMPGSQLAQQLTLKDFDSGVISGSGD